MLKIGHLAPDFSAPAYLNSEFTTVSLDSYRGEWVVLLFYPGDFTFVCATEVSAAAENYGAFKALGAEVLTVSVDSPYVHKAWLEQEVQKMSTLAVEFPMVSDVSGKIGTLYGVFDETQLFNHRGCFIIDPDGVVQSAFITNPSVGRSYEELFRLLAGLVHIRKNKKEALPCDWMPGDKVLVPSADMVGKIHGVWTTANMSIGKFRQSEGGSIWTSDRMRFGEKEK